MAVQSAPKYYFCPFFDYCPPLVEGMINVENSISTALWWLNRIFSKWKRHYDCASGPKIEVSLKVGCLPCAVGKYSRPYPWLILEENEH